MPRPKPSNGPVATSLLQAAKLSGLSVDALQWAKSEGCLAFQNHRVYIGDLQSWWKQCGEKFTSDSELPSEEILDRKLKWQKFNTLAFADACRRKEFLPAKAVLDGLRAIGDAQRALLRAKLEHEAPSKLEGLDTIARREFLARVVDEICAIFAANITKWDAPVKKPPTP